MERSSPMWVALTRGTVEARSRSYAPTRTEPVTRDQAAALLAAEVQRAVAAGGRVEHATDLTAVIVHGQRPSHVLHLLLSVVTAGLWLVVWLLAAVTNRPVRVLLAVDECGNITRRRA
jgi:hypothetical protein